MVKNSFTVNGASYYARPFDFDLVCELEDMDVSFDRITKMPMSLIRAYFAICADCDKEHASAIIQKHIIGGGKIDDITNAMSKEMEDSDFFRALSKNEEQTSTESKKKKKESSEESDSTNQLNFG